MQLTDTPMRFAPFALVLLFVLPSFSAAQDTDIPLNHDLYHYVDRLLIKGAVDTPFYSVVKPYNRHALERLFGTYPTRGMGPNERAWHLRMRRLADDAYADSAETRPVWKHFYRNGRDVYHLRQPHFQLYVNPILNLGVGTEQLTEPEGSLFLLNNSRGAVVRGNLYNKLGFYTELFDNVSFFKQFLLDDYRRRGNLYGESFVKRFGERENGFNFFTARAYLTFRPIPAVRVKLGKDRAFWGDGFQSLVLSDQPTDHLFLNLHTRIWKLSYVNHFAQMIDFIPGKSDTEGTFPRKYSVFHQLTYQHSPRLSISVFESIVYSPHLANGDRGFEWQYLNPVIFYRAAEQAIGSPDNGMLGMSARIHLFRRLQLYGQLLIDDFNFGIRDQGDGYWGNKYGYQLGAKYIDAFGVNSLDLQLEYNRLRPYTYQHFSVAANYSHYGQSLGHAAGANLYDWHVQLRYHPLPAWNLHLSYLFRRQGLDENGINHGSDYNLSYSVNRAGDFDQTVAQGLAVNLHQVHGRLTYQLWKTDAYLELEGRYRRTAGQNALSLMGSLRMNLPGRLPKF